MKTNLITPDMPASYPPVKKKPALRVLLETLVHLGMGVFIMYLTCNDCLNFTARGLGLALYGGLFWLLLWKGNEFIHHRLNEKMSWIETPGKRFAAGMVLMVVYSFSIVLLLNYAHFSLFLGYSWGRMRSVLIYSTAVSMAITFFVTLFLHGLAFLFAWRQSAINEQKLRAEMLSSRYEALKSQVNPHFLFNSLNVLTALVYKDQDLAARFIRKLGDVYRYVLDTRETETVPLKTELAFLEDYVFLQKIRYAESLQVTVNLPDPAGLEVPPLSVQMLVENAVRHNVIAEDEPLQVSIGMEDGRLAVRNNLNPKQGVSGGAGLGLHNIKARYEFLSSAEVVIEKTASHFTVKLPLLHAKTGGGPAA